MQEARAILNREDITLVLLDVNLPDGNGIDFVREIRKNSQVPIILLTVNNMEVDIVTGLEQFNVKVREKNITLSLCDTDLHIRCDSKWTVEALGNIVDNAIKYTACGGNVQIKVEQYSFFVKIDIIDDGIGIEKEEIPKIFGRFYRSLSVADQPGVGIGLFLAREIIQAQKGYIKVTSKRGKGSTFSVFLPIAKKE